MLFEGALLLFSHDEVRYLEYNYFDIYMHCHQVASGTDLAKLYIDTLNDEGAQPQEIHFVRISK